MAFVMDDFYLTNKKLLQRTGYHLEPLTFGFIRKTLYYSYGTFELVVYSLVGNKIDELIFQE